MAIFNLQGEPMSRDPQTVRLVDEQYTFHRPNKHIAPQPWRDVLDVVGWAVLGFLLLIIVIVGMA